ncbi:MAG: NAD(P)H-dependent oxidoreductase [Pseudomonadota bacterium]
MLLGISGSLRAASVNTKLVREAGRIYGGDFELGDLRLPLYDGDLESAEGIPAEVQRLADQIAAAEAVVISTPEYNQSLSGVLKNALDWVSRVEGKPWLHKPVAILSAAAGRSGGARGSYALRLAMLTFRPRMVTGPDIAVAGAAKEFDEDGRLTGELYLKNLTEVMDQLREEARR